VLPYGDEPGDTDFLCQPGFFFVFGFFSAPRQVPHRIFPILASGVSQLAKRYKIIY
jgi:hypothetical protein